MKQLFLGGVRSGKSQMAEAAALCVGKPVTYIATAQLLDEEIRTRAEKHRARRPAGWVLVEEPLALADALRQHAQPASCVLVDCLTLWLNNLVADSVKTAHDEVDHLNNALSELGGDIIFVSSEVGLGMIPANALARTYADLLGELNQTIAARCDRVTLAIAGLPSLLKDRKQ